MIFKKQLFSLLLITLTVSTIGQTKWIAHKSHSGSNSSFFTDPGNSSSGPGMRMDDRIYMREVSDIKLDFEPLNQYKLPIVSINWEKTSLLFFDVKDSPVGCDRDFREYLSPGALVFNKDDNRIYTYHSSFKSQLQDITDSVLLWNEQGLIGEINSQIFTKDDKQIPFKYPILSNTKLNEITNWPIPIDEIKTIEPEEKSTIKIETSAPTKTKKKKAEKAQKKKAEKKENKKIKKSGIDANYGILFGIITILFLLNFLAGLVKKSKHSQN